MNPKIVDPVQTVKNLLKIKPKGRTKLFRLECVNPAKNNNKFYECWIEPEIGADGAVRAFNLYALWGAIGTSGTKAPKGNGREAYCIQEAEGLKKEKMKKGYKVVTQS